MKFHIQFSRKNKKNSIGLSSGESAHRMLSVKEKLSKFCKGSHTRATSRLQKLSHFAKPVAIPLRCVQLR